MFHIVELLNSAYIELKPSTSGDMHHFWQISMAPESQQYTTFMVGNLGFYEFTRMSFGMCNATATFQNLMLNTLGELSLTYCIIYLDDVIIFWQTEEEHLECLQVVFECVSEFNLKLKVAKCFFFLDRNSVPHASCDK